MDIIPEFKAEETKSVGRPKSMSVKAYLSYIELNGNKVMAMVMERNITAARYKISKALTGDSFVEMFGEGVSRSSVLTSLRTRRMWSISEQDWLLPSNVMVQTESTPGAIFVDGAPSFELWEEKTARPKKG